MTERTEWPTAARIRELRDLGIVHYSPVATGCAVAAGLCFFARAEVNSVGGALDRYRAALAVGEAVQAWWSLLETCGRLALGSMVVVGLVVGGAIAVQTRVFFSPGLVGLRLQRLWVGGFLSPMAPLRRAFGALGVVGLGVGIAALIFGWLSRDMAALLNHGVDYTLQRPRDWFESSLPVLGVLLALAAPLVWGLSRVRFLLRHRMTRAEVLREQGGE